MHNPNAFWRKVYGQTKQIELFGHNDMNDNRYTWRSNCEAFKTKYTVSTVKHALGLKSMMALKHAIILRLFCCQWYWYNGTGAQSGWNKKDYLKMLQDHLVVETWTQLTFPMMKWPHLIILVLSSLITWELMFNCHFSGPLKITLLMKTGLWNQFLDH